MIHRPPLEKIVVQVRTLGELRQLNDGNAPGSRLRRKPLALVCYLARHAPRSITRTELATLLWGESGERRARQSLRQALTEIKQVLGDAVDVDAESVRLAADAVELDIVQFERELAAGRVQEAVGRWSGDFLAGSEDIAGDGFRRWVENERAALHAQLGIALSKLVDEAERRADRAGAVAWARRWATALPFEEAAHTRLIQALSMSGRGADAMQAHAAFVTRLRTSLDTEPSDAFLHLRDDLTDNARDELVRRGRGSAAIHTPALIGRAPIMTALMDACTAAHDGPVIVVLEGSAGTGLTRICDEMIERVRDKATILRTRARAGMASLGTAAELFATLRNIDGTAGAAPEALAEVATLVPGLATRFPHLPPPTGGAAALTTSLAQVIDAVSEDQPVLIVLDDLHAADEATRHFLSSLAAHLAGRVLLLVAVDGSDRRVQTSVAELRRIKGLRLLRLDELTPNEVDAMLESMITLDASDRRRLAHRLHEETRGVPHDVRELVTSLIGDELLTHDVNGTWHLSSSLDAGRPIAVPATVRDRARSRLEGLSERARVLAHAMAVIGAPTDLASAGAVAQLSADDAAAGMDDLLTSRVVRASAARENHFELASPLLARAIAGLLTATQRDALLARVRSQQPASSAAPTLPQRHRRRPMAQLALLAIAATAVLAAVVWKAFPARTLNASKAVPIVALGKITDYREGATTSVSKPLTDMLATNLGRVPRLRVVSAARMYELASQSGNAADTSAAAVLAAARRAGATELVDGALYGRADGDYRLDLRRVQLSTGNIQRTHSVTGATIFELADSGTARLAADFGEVRPNGSIADVTTKSLAAYHLYEQGLRLYYNGDLAGAEPLFLAAQREDSTFAMAAFYSGMSLLDRPYVKLRRLTDAARLATHTTDRERLTILANLAFDSSSPALRAISDTLMVRYPDEVEGYYFNGLASLQGGDYLRARATFDRVVAMDSLAFSGARARCVACEALRQVISAYQLADSLSAAERETRRWTRLQPQSSAAWNTLADVLSQSGRAADAVAALDHAAVLDSGRSEAIRLQILAQHRIYAGDFEQADRLLQSELDAGSPSRTAPALWYRVISFRAQGRLAEALADAKRLRAMVEKTYPSKAATRLRSAPAEAMAEAQVLYEMRRLRESAALFDSVSRWRVGEVSESQIAHAHAWAMTHALGSHIAAADTNGVVARTDTLERLGPASGLARDGLLHHHVRGLLLAARGQDESAITELRKGIISWNFGYTRTNVALANVLMREGRAREAVAVLQPALRGSLESSNYYVSRTDLHEQLALAWAGVSDPAARDSARSHFAYVARAWQRADPMFADRLKRARDGAAR